MFKIFFSIVFAALMISEYTLAHDNFSNADELLPRGSNIGKEAGHCDVGPFGKTGDTGMYHGFCSRLTASEKCFAYAKQHLLTEGEIVEVIDSAKATFCTDLLARRLFD